MTLHIANREDTAMMHPYLMLWARYACEMQVAYWQAAAQFLGVVGPQLRQGVQSSLVTQAPPPQELTDELDGWRRALGLNPRTDEDRS